MFHSPICGPFRANLPHPTWRTRLRVTHRRAKSGRLCRGAIHRLADRRRVRRCAAAPLGREEDIDAAARRVGRKKKSPTPRFFNETMEHKRHYTISTHGLLTGFMFFILSGECKVVVKCVMLFFLPPLFPRRVVISGHSTTFS